MYLKTLELHGFKSFPNRTVLTFERGATVIVGPNGSGKSNISDAMRWVLGELSSRNIRGTKMEDVIFGGTDDRRPMGFAEVSVTFDNTDPENRLDSEFDEVTVTRRYFRTGESEYLINREKKRLRDIYELFMNTGVGREGYSIIGQGKIAEIISKKSDERRQIFEEAAGISKYRHRKEESERKLKATQENLDRVKDILSVLEDRVVPLEKEAEKARKGLAIYEEKKRADVSLWLFDTQKIIADIEEAENAWKLSKHELEIIDQVISDLEAQGNNLYEKAQANRLTSERLITKIRETDNKLHELDSALQMADSDFRHSAELIKQSKERISDIEASKASLDFSRKEYENKKADIEVNHKKLLDTRLEYLSEIHKLKENVSSLGRQLEELLDELTVEENGATDLKIRIDVLKNSKVSDNTKSIDIEKEIEKYEAEGVSLKEEAERCEQNAAGFKAKISEKDEIICSASAKNDKLLIEKNQENERLNSFTVERDTLSQRADMLQRMTDHFEGYYESVKFVMREYNGGNINTSGRVHGPLSSLINVDKKYITAIETALGSSLQNIVVDNEEVAKSCMGALKRANAGRATFYPITAIRTMSETDEIREAASMPGYIGRADTLVNSNKEYRAIIEWLLLRTVVFDNIESASVAAKKLRYKVKIVTLDGQIINAGGAFTGGSAKKDSGILSRLTEISTLRDKSAALTKKINESRDIIADILAEIAKNQDVLKDAEQEKELLLTLSRTQFAALDSANAQYSANRNIVEKLKFDYNNLIGQQSVAENEITRLSAEYDAALERIAALKKVRAEKAAESGVLDEKCDEFEDKANEVYVKVAETRKDIESVQLMIDNINSRIGELDTDKEAQQARIEELTSKRNNIDNIKAENKAEYAALESELQRLNEERREVESGNDEFEREIASVREKTKEKNASRQTFYEAMIRNENKYNHLLEKQDKLGSQLWDDYEITYEDAVALDYPAVNEENREEVAAIQTSCRAKLRALGNYNPGAIEEYAEVKTQYDSLNTQFVDLTSSYDELIGIISRLEGEMRTSFITAFEDINKNFGKTFKELFGGGNAELSLVDPEDVLTSGIEIKAAPPGKIIKSLSLLSGGEQSFVAIALLFAILKVNPTPFCILDEIEAALDEVNVFRFGEYIKKFDDGTQFILITHRRGTMEIGDRLYGVTMPQRGISQAIELNVNEIEGKQKELLDGVL
ncbi:MAG: chromosome segregation protein SMC [Ruminococcaceae bacterium]|nr:chromosome segregation protein SMC [Oscillospiraceae bacterium]